MLQQVSFVVIGYNEGGTLERCLHSVRAATESLSLGELIYVDGGSVDGSLAIAEACGVDKLLGGDKRRRAAENRNLGLAQAQGEFVQFVDGDMTLAKDWPETAVGFLASHPDTAAVCGNLREAARGAFVKAFEIDWAPREGYVRHCGGAAMYRREVLVRLGGFPEDVRYGEEPYLCWRIRNELGLRIYQLDRRMADHDLGYSGFRDYWRRNLRMGATCAEIAARCFHSHERLWFRESLLNLFWAAALIAGALALLLAPPWLKLSVLIVAALVIVRKAFQTLRRGYAPQVALAYALHTYFSKLPFALGQLGWWRRRKERGP